MFESVEDLSIISHLSPSFTEEKTIPVSCWQEVCLSKIWIPSGLLPNRKKPSTTWMSKGVFHTLEKRGHAKQIESFSVYSDSGNESEADVFLSDSDDILNLDSINDVATKENSQGFFEKTEIVSTFKSSLCKEKKNVEPNVSLHEILNSTTEVDIRNFEIKKNHKDKSEEAETFKSNKKNKRNKKKNKMIKPVLLDTFLEGYTEENRQEDYANDYLRTLLTSQNTDKLQLKNNSEFPDLSPKEIQFAHSEKPIAEKPIAEKPEMSFKTFSGILSQHHKTKKDNITSHIETVTPQPKPDVEKIVIENIPSEYCQSDILTILYGYGEVKDFSFEPDGDFLKAVVEFDSDSNIDWITESLDKSAAFGVSTRMLKCYRQ